VKGGAKAGEQDLRGDGQTAAPAAFPSCNVAPTSAAGEPSLHSCAEPTMAAVHYDLREGVKQGELPNAELTSVCDMPHADFWYRISTGLRAFLLVLPTSG